MNASGLSTDIFFAEAIKSNTDLMNLLPAHDVYDNVANPDEDMDNVPVPYIVVNNDGGQNVAESKDDDYESPDDRVNISVRIVACNREQLDEIATAVRKTVHGYMYESESELKPYDYEFSFSDIAFIPDKPSHQVVFYYLCQVTNNLNECNDEQENL
jgi:hypothetical protein